MVISFQQKWKAFFIVLRTMHSWHLSTCECPPGICHHGHLSCLLLKFSVDPLHIFWQEIWCHLTHHSIYLLKVSYIDSGHLNKGKIPKLRNLWNILNPNKLRMEDEGVGSLKPNIRLNFIPFCKLKWMLIRRKTRRSKISYCVHSYITMKCKY